MAIMFDGLASSGAIPTDYLAVEEPYLGAISVVDGPNGIGPMFRFRNKVTDPYVYGDWRTELAAQHEIAGSERWYYLGLYLPRATIPDDMRNALLFQLHSVDPVGEDWGRNPPCDIGLINYTNLVINTRYDATVTSIPSPNSITTIVEGAVSTYNLFDRIVPIVVHTIMKWDTTGLFEVWLDHRPIVKRIGPMAFNDPEGPYAKIGIGHLRHGGSGIETIMYNTGLLIGDATSSYYEMTGRYPFPWALYPHGVI